MNTFFSINVPGNIWDIFMLDFFPVVDLSANLTGYVIFLFANSAYPSLDSNPCGTQGAKPFLLMIYSSLYPQCLAHSRSPVNNLSLCDDNDKSSKIL